MGHLVPQSRLTTRTRAFSARDEVKWQRHAHDHYCNSSAKLVNGALTSKLTLRLAKLGPSKRLASIVYRSADAAEFSGWW